jgi:hypothetical protein
MLTGIQATAGENADAAAAAQSTADNAAQAAATAAGIADGKADVLIQPGTPDASYEKDTTLWIDTSNNANTPKRWDGTAWQVVTDKAATDAATAAAAAQATADAAQQAASDVNARVDTEATTRAQADSALSTRIDSVESTVGDNTAAIQAEQTARADGDSANAQAIMSVQSSLTSDGTIIRKGTFEDQQLGAWMPDPNNAHAGTATCVVYPISGQPEAYALRIAQATVIEGNYGSGAEAKENDVFEFYGECYLNNMAGSSHSYPGISWCDANGNEIGYVYFGMPSGNGWQAVRGVATAMAGTVTVLPFLNFGYDAANPSSYCYWKNLKITKRGLDQTAAATASLETGATIGGKSYAAATVMVDADGRIGGTRLSSDGTTSSFVVVAD